MAKDEPKQEEHPKAEKPAKDETPTPEHYEPKGPFEEIFCGIDGPDRAHILDILVPNSSRQYTLEELENITRIPTTKIKAALEPLVKLRVAGWENPTEGMGRIGYNSEALGLALQTFYGRWRTFVANQKAQ